MRSPRQRRRQAGFDIDQRCVSRRDARPIPCDGLIDTRDFGQSLLLREGETLELMNAPDVSQTFRSRSCRERLLATRQP